jgi:hypothetical protein
VASDDLAVVLASPGASDEETGAEADFSQPENANTVKSEMAIQRLKTIDDV